MLISLKDSYATFNFNNTLTYSEYFALLYPLFKKMQETILEGEKIQLPFGTLAILKVLNKFQASGVNWAVSMTIRRKMIKDGILPLEIIRDKDGNRVSDNGGEPYFMYFTEDHYYALNIGKERQVEVENNKYRFMTFRSFKYNKQRIENEKPHLKTVYGAY